MSAFSMPSMIVGLSRLRLPVKAIHTVPVAWLLTTRVRPPFTARPPWRLST